MTQAPHTPARLDALTQQVVTLTARVPASEAVLTALRAEFPAETLAPVAQNTALAREQLAFAEKSIADGRDAVALPVGKQGPAVGAIRAAEGALTQALGRLFALAENYPQLRANENVKMLQEELASTENKVGFARQFYNDIATKYNIAREVFPANVVAGLFRFDAAELFEIADAAERQVPAVDLSMKK